MTLLFPYVNFLKNRQMGKEKFDVVLINHEVCFKGSLQAISDRIEFMVGLEPKTKLIYNQETLDEFFENETADFVLVDSFFGQKENSDLEIVPKIREKFPDAKIVSYSIFEPKDRKMYDIVLDIASEDGDTQFERFCSEISLKIKPE